MAQRLTRGPQPAWASLGAWPNMAIWLRPATKTTTVSPIRRRRSRRDPDELPADLDPSQVTAPYLFPNNSRRKIPAVLYTLIGIGCIAGRPPAMTPCSSTAASCRRHRADCHRALPLAGRAGISFDEEQALGAAAEEVGFPAGHASAQLGWRGLRSRPTWRILLYSNESSREAWPGARRRRERRDHRSLR